MTEIKNKDTVGAGIVNIITESLYDKPIVIFREYVQNSVDSFSRNENSDEFELRCNIWEDNNSLYFLDNGKGIEKASFHDEMRKIAFSGKNKVKNIGYKGIGRLSGISYCNKLTFINILSYKNKDFQQYTIDVIEYNRIKSSKESINMSFNDLMNKIGKLAIEVDEKYEKIVIENNECLSDSDTGFLVILEELNTVFANLLKEEDLCQQLGWLLPVEFDNALFNGDLEKLHGDLTREDEQGNVAVKGFNIYYNDKKIVRPITKDMLRDYTCECDLKYGIGFHTFRSDKIVVEKNNLFSGIRVYIDNMLLCDETELIPMLKKYGLIEHTTNELFQTVNAIGAMIYITDKVNISANARRTFIEVGDAWSIEFLNNISEFIERIYSARYALSKYSSYKKTNENNEIKLSELKIIAEQALITLADRDIQFAEEDDIEFDSLSIIEKKKKIKQKISKEINNQMRNYLSQLTEFDYENAYEDFVTWISSNIE